MHLFRKTIWPVSKLAVVSLVFFAMTASAQKRKPDPAARKMMVESHYLHLPVKRGTPAQHLSLYVNGAKVREIQIELAPGQPDFWVYTDMGEWMGKTLVIERDPEGKEPLKEAGADYFSALFQSDAKDGGDWQYQEKLRPQFHFTSRRGWLNDPNGLVFYAGEWHLFYQHNPFGTGWGNMTWGHAVSKDLVHWQEMDDALQPDKMGTMFSGSGVVDAANTTGFKTGTESPLVLMYTAAGKNSNWSADAPFTQCIAYSNDRGRHWTKYEKNPVIGLKVEGNRDPKLVWHEATHQWIVAMYLDGNDYVLLSSPDLKHWTELQKIKMEGSGECPDFFEIALDEKQDQKKWVLTGANDRYLVGHFDGKTFTPEQAPQQGDWGTNYYAVQSYSGVTDGRRIQIGWMNGAEMPGMPFNQQMAFPRELTLQSTPAGPRLFSRPAREIALLHAGSYRRENLLLKSGSTGNPLRSLQGELFHIKADFDLSGPKDGMAKEIDLTVRGFRILYNTVSGLLSVSNPRDTAIRSAIVPAVGGKFSLEILLDRASIEVFAGDGAVPMAFAFIPDEKEQGIRLMAKDGDILVKELEVSDLKPGWE